MYKTQWAYSVQNLRTGEMREVIEASSGLHACVVVALSLPTLGEWRGADGPTGLATVKQGGVEKAVAFHYEPRGLRTGGIPAVGDWCFAGRNEQSVLVK